jgi:TRAP-type mannitol/chloroaromatic compound transport system substrate-binding protein
MSEGSAVHLKHCDVPANTHRSLGGNLNMTSFRVFVAGSALALMASLASSSSFAADQFKLSFQTHHAANSLQGEALLRFAERAKEMSAGRLNITMHTSSAVVKSSEAFESAATGIIDGDATGAGYITGKNPAFQFFGDIMGGYETPYQILGWYKNGGGKDIAQPLYEKFNMHLIGVFVATPESLGSTTPLNGIDDLKGWKFRSPPGMESEIFQKLGAAPVVMAFGEVFSAMSSGTVSGADASTLAVNKGLGLYDVGKHATYPGFHSMPIEHVTINLDKWHELPADLQRILEAAVDTIAVEVAAKSEVMDKAAATELVKSGVVLHDWSTEDRLKFRTMAQEVWADWATRSPEAKQVYDAHVAYMKQLGIL